jgi:hypothetical protein
MSTSEMITDRKPKYLERNILTLCARSALGVGKLGSHPGSQAGGTIKLTSQMQIHQCFMCILSNFMAFSAVPAPNS